MRRNDAQKSLAEYSAGLKIRLIAGAMLLGIVPAFAGDRAQANYIGFSDDGRYFAFEQYGILDGSGGFYSDVFVIDLAGQDLLEGAPFSAAADGEDMQNIADTRATAVRAAQPLLEKNGIDNPVSIAALNGDGALGQDNLALDNKSIHFGQPFYAGIQYDYVLTLEQIDVSNSKSCAVTADWPYQGFALSLTNNEAMTTREVHRDLAQETLPASRGCALGYSIYSIVYPLDGEGDSIALISVYSRGFEGLDRRFLAVPLGGL